MYLSEEEIDEMLETIDYMREEQYPEKQIKCLFDLLEKILSEEKYYKELRKSYGAEGEQNRKVGL